MSTTATGAFERTAYEAPTANLVDHADQTENKLFSAEGRIGVLRYNALFAKVMFVFIVAGAALYGAMTTESQVAMAIIGVPVTILFVAGFVALVYAAIKRLHDLGHSGWFYLISMIPIVGTIFMLYYALKPGSEDDNAYGAHRDTKRLDKVLGVIGIVMMVGINIVALIPMS